MDIRKQGVINTIGNIVYLIALWLLSVITTQMLGYKAVGALTLAMAIGNVVANVQIYGVRGYQSSDMSFCYAPIDYLRVRFITVAIGFLLGVTVCIMLSYPLHLCITVILFMLIKSSETFSDVLFGNVQRLGHLEIAGYSMFARGIFIVLLFYVGAFLFKSLNMALLFTSIGMVLLTLLFDFPIHRRLIKNSGNVSPNSMSNILKICFPLFVGGVIPAAIMTIPRIILESFYGPVVLGFYGNVSTPSLILPTAIPIILTALLPMYGEAVIIKDFRFIRKLWIRSITGTMIVCVICLLGVYFWGRQLLTLLYTEQILPYVHYLYLIFISMMFYSFVFCNNAVLVSMHSNHVIAISAVLSFVVCLVISVPFVSSYGIGGAISVLMISFGIKALVQAIWILKLCSG